MKNNYLANVFGWLFIGLLVTFASGFLLTLSPKLLVIVFSYSINIFLYIAQIALCLFLVVRIHKMQPTTAKIIYLLYAFLTGCTFATIFLIFDLSSIIMVFLVTAILFGIFALIGKYTKIDLSKWGIYLLIALLAILVLEIINIFVMNNTLDIVTCVIGVIIFLGYVAYDIHNILKNNYGLSNEEKLAILGAFELYLDFINIFIRLLRLLGKSRD